MKLHRIDIQPRSPWRTPWHADTLVGALCVTAARTRGASFLRTRLIDPMLDGTPPFVLSDAFPERSLPIPAALRLIDLPPGADPKRVKKAMWLTTEDFGAAQSGLVPEVDRFLPDTFHTETRRHNTIGRENGASLETGGLFARPDISFSESAANSRSRLSIYFRVRNEFAQELFVELLHELSLTGFGADASAGRGQFDVVDDPVPTPELDFVTTKTNGVVVLSTFQPAPGDPTDGLWETFAKFGKLGPDFGVADVRKHTLILFRPGACFRAQPTVPFLGRAIPMEHLLPKASRDHLRSRDIEIIHSVYGLGVPAQFKEPWIG